MLSMDYLCKLSHNEHLQKVAYADLPMIRAVINFIKPATIIERSSFMFVRDILKSMDDNNFKLIKNIFVNIEMIGKRLIKDYRFAKKIGWKFDKSIERNVLLIYRDHVNDIVKSEYKLGFMLGYPISAIKYWKIYKRIDEKKDVILPLLLDQYFEEFDDISEESNEIFEKLDDFELMDLSVIVSYMKKIFNDKNMTDDEPENILRKMFIEKIDFFINFYKKIGNLSVKESIIIVYRDYCHICDDEGRIIYSFVVDGRMKKARDVIELENSVLPLEL